MFELLLQADKALTEGSFDQAERTYWQLIELDPTNAIAVAGLARISLERRDERSARTFADRALSIDPDSITARRVLETLDHTGAEPAESERHESPGLPLLAAERLEALSRRRGKDRATSASPAPGKGARGRTLPDQVVPLPSEPLPERRRTGRLSAAAAAAAATARQPARARREPHHAMPVGRRFFGPEGLKAPPSDAFSDAEMAAAVAAVDALDESGAAVAQDRGIGGQADVLGAVDATAADESVALRLALMADIVDPEADEADETDAEAAAADAEAAAADAEAAAVAEAVNEVAGSADDIDAIPGPARRIIKETSGEEPSEEEAEAQALREAIAIVLEGDDDGGAADGPSATVQSARTLAVEGPASVEAQVESTKQAAVEPTGEPATGSEPTTETEPSPDSPSRKRGILHRIRGS